ncbi:tetratricopeptide repeat protein [Acidobacteria bacterium AH-259-L09]|nr:tetratricopeptide repeat protein [Acidobacteria bacterium AH-259-L09]
MKRQLILVLVIGLVFVAVLSGYTQQSAKQLLQSGLYKEDVKGDLDAAIQIYRTIIQDFPDNRSVASKALLQMGQCYEKLGKAEARKAYERVLRDYADQQEQVAAARARLAALQRPARVADRSGIVVRRVWAGPEQTVKRTVSADGRYLLLEDWATHDLIAHDLATGKKRRLTNSTDPRENIEPSVLSRDGKQVVYELHNREGFDELHIVGIDGSGDRLLYRNWETRSIAPYAWSPDGKHILVKIRLRDRTWQIALVSVADGSLRVLKSLEWRSPQVVSLSPDGRYIVYDVPTEQDSPDRDIYLLSTDGRWEAPLIEHPAVDHSPVWAPDGKRVVVARARAGPTGLWVIPVADGKPQGSPELVKPDMGRIRPLGFTHDGSYYYALRTTAANDIYTAEMDPATGKITMPPARAIERFVGSSRDPDWSPDGKYLAYVLTRGPVPYDPGSRVLVIRSIETGEERELSPRLNSFEPRWSPDGRFLLVGGVERGRFDLCRIIDAQTGDVVGMVQGDPGQSLRGASWSPDGKSIFYLLRHGTKKGTSILVRDLETGQEKELYRVTSPERIFDLVPSADGRHLAFLPPNKTSTALKLLPTMGGEPRELLRAQKEERIGSLAWTPDGRYLLFGKSHPTEKKVVLWRIPAEGGEPQKLGLAMEGLVHLRVHPDGRQIAFTARQFKQEVWVMENFLPELSSTQ